jgi:hypothetical protein
VSEIVTGAPRFRLSYRHGADGLLKREFDIVPPGKPEAFAQYLVWESRKAATDSKTKPERGIERSMGG